MGQPFDPSKKPEGAAGETDAEWGVPAGYYLLGIKVWKRKPTKAGDGFYAEVVVVVLDGPKKGNLFKTRISLDASKQGSANRLFYLCGAMNWTKAIDLDDDRECREAFQYRGFKAEVSAAQNGKYVNNDLAKAIPWTRLSPEEKTTIERWNVTAQEEAEARRAGSGGGGGSPADYQDGGSYDGGYDDSPHPATGGVDVDDIPF